MTIHGFIGPEVLANVPPPPPSPKCEVCGSPDALVYGWIDETAPPHYGGQATLRSDCARRRFAPKAV